MTVDEPNLVEFRVFITQMTSPWEIVMDNSLFKNSNPPDISYMHYGENREKCCEKWLMFYYILLNFDPWLLCCISAALLTILSQEVDFRWFDLLERNYLMNKIDNRKSTYIYSTHILDKLSVNSTKVKVWIVYHNQ